MRYRNALVAAVVVGLLAAPTAAAHVTFNPGEWEAGGFARFAIRVPNESDTARTTRITVQFPEEVVSARFQPAPGWKRTIEMVALDEPIETEGGEPITERIGSVTWSGGEIKLGEFEEFGVSFRVSEDADELLFPTVQVYGDGEEAAWIDPAEEAERPAPRVAVVPAAEEEEAAVATASAEGEDGAAAAGSGGQSDDSTATLALVFGIAGLVAGLLALALAFLRPRRAARTQ